MRTPIGEAHILSSDEQEIRSDPESTESVRLLPSGDSYFLLSGEDRSLLISRTDRRDLLWTSRVWPGALLVHGEIVGTWRRSTNVSNEPWRRLSRTAQEKVAEEARSLPLPNLEKEIVVHLASA